MGIGLFVLGVCLLGVSGQGDENGAPTARPATSTNAPAEGLRPIKPPVPLRQPWMGWRWLVAGLFTLGSIAALAYLLRSAKKPQVPDEIKIQAVTGPPHLVALRQLDEARAFLDHPYRFCIILSDALREYLEREFGIPARAASTEELIAEFAQRNPLLDSYQKQVIEILQACDLVKFARAEMPKDRLQQLHRQAVDLVRETHAWAGQRGSSAQRERMGEKETSAHSHFVVGKEKD